MIEFNGFLTGCAKKHFIKRLRFGYILLMEFMLIMSIPFWFSFGYSINRVWGTVVLLIVMSLAMAMLGYLCVTKKEKQRMNLKKIKIFNGRIFSFSENSKTTNKLSSVKCVRDYGDFYDIVFPCFFFVSVYVCQKDLISKGSLKEFE